MTRSSPVQHPVLQPGPVRRLHEPPHQLWGRLPRLLPLRDPQERLPAQQARHWQARHLGGRVERVHGPCDARVVREAGEGEGVERWGHGLAGASSRLFCLSHFPGV